MAFIVALILTTFAIAGSAAFFSVYGLAHTFSGAFWAVVFMGTSLEAGKLISVSFLYRYWKIIKWGLKSYLIGAVFLLMVITSVGIFAFLSAAYQTDTLEYKGIETQITSLTSEKEELTKRKKDIDIQISQLPADYVAARQRLMRTFKPELDHINTRLPQITAELSKVNQQRVAVQAHTGPITYIASAFGATVDDATKWIVLMLIIVFDPLAIALTLAVNIVILSHKNDGVVKSSLSDLMAQQKEPLMEMKPEAVQSAPPILPVVVQVPPVEKPITLTVTEPDVPNTSNLYTITSEDELQSTPTIVTGTIAEPIVEESEPVSEPVLVSEEPVKVEAVEEPSPEITTIKKLKQAYTEPDAIELSHEDLHAANNMVTTPSPKVVPKQMIRQMFAGPVTPEDDNLKK